MWFFLAAALELFYDCVPETTPIDRYPFVHECLPKLAEKGWTLTTWEKREENTWVFWNLGPKLRQVDFGVRPREKMVLFLWEPPVVQQELYRPEVQAPFGKIFTWDDDLVDGKRFFKFHYPVLQARIEKIPSFQEKKFCVMIARRLSSPHPKQLYGEREKMIRFFEDKPQEFDLYGMYWEKRRYKNWRGAIEDKLAVLKNYRFAICYENTRDVRGYITEKIFDCFAVGVVPVYWGASNVTEYIPEGCFIDRRKFKDERAVYEFLKGVTKEEYARYLEAAAAFLKSERAQVFSSARFTETFLQIIDQTEQKPSS